MSLFEGNLAVLAQRHPVAAAVLGGAGGVPDPGAGPRSDVQVSPTPSGVPTLAVNGVSWHSRYDPVKEARAAVEREVPPGATAIIVVGFGLGYAAEAALRSHPGLPVLVVEPDAEVFRWALSCRDLSGFLQAPQVSLWLDPRPEGLTTVLESLPLARPAVLRLRPAFQAHPLLYRSPDEYVQSWLLRKDINTNTLARFGRLWVRNLCRNMTPFAAQPGVARLEGLFKGLPGLVIAGGPSLDTLLPLLPSLRERMVVVAVNTPVRSCNHVGVSPDVTVIVDPQYWASRYLDWTSASAGIVVAEPSTAPRALRAGAASSGPGAQGADASRAAGPPTDAAPATGAGALPLFLCSSLFPLGEHLEGAVGPRGSLGAGGSVTTTAWDLARLLGCSPIYAAGLDLGFPGMRTHCRGVYAEDLWLSTTHRLDPVEGRSCRALREAGLFSTRSAGGGTTPTDRRMLLYKWWFENQLAMRPEVQAFTLSPDGTEIAGMAVADPRALLGLPRRRDEIDAGLAAARRIAGEGPGPRLAAAAVRAALVELDRGLAELEGLSQKGRGEVARLGRALENHGDPSGPLAALDAVDAAILGVSARTIAGFLIQGIIHGITGESTVPGNPGDVVARSRAIYEGIEESARWQRGLLTRARREMDALAAGAARG